MKINENTKKIVSISEKPGKFGVKFHNEGYSYFGLDYVYLPLKLMPKDLESFVSLARHNFEGFSVSMPYKIEVIKYIDKIDGEAKKIGAVNTVVKREGFLVGYNTDYEGAKKYLEETLRLDKKRVNLIGAGGFARAIGFAVKELGGDISVFNRDENKAKNLAKILECESYPLEMLEKIDGDLLINATSLGMNGEDFFNYSLIEKHDYIMDAVFGQTNLIKKAKSLKKIVLPGTKMAVYQGAEQFKIYTGKELPKNFLKIFLED